MDNSGSSGSHQKSGVPAAAGLPAGGLCRHVVRERVRRVPAIFSSKLSPDDARTIRSIDFLAVATAQRQEGLVSQSVMVPKGLEPAHDEPGCDDETEYDAGCSVDDLESDDGFEVLVVGDRVREVGTGRVGTLAEDDGSGRPYRVVFDETPHLERWLQMWDVVKCAQSPQKKSSDEVQSLESFINSAEEVSVVGFWPAAVGEPGLNCPSSLEEVSVAIQRSGGSAERERLPRLITVETLRTDIDPAAEAPPQRRAWWSLFG